MTHRLAHSGSLRSQISTTLNGEGFNGSPSFLADGADLFGWPTAPREGNLGPPDLPEPCHRQRRPGPAVCATRTQRAATDKTPKPAQLMPTGFNRSPIAQRSRLSVA